MHTIFMKCYDEKYRIKSENKFFLSSRVFYMALFQANFCNFFQTLKKGAIFVGLLNKLLCIFKMSQCMTKGGLWHDVISVRKEHYDVTAVYLSICTKSKSFEQWKIYAIEK